MQEWLQKIFVYSLSYYFFVYFFFVWTFISWSSSPPLLFNWLHFEVAYYPLLNIFCEKLRENSFTHLAFPNFSFVCFHWKITWHIGKVNRKIKTERVNNWIDAQSSCLGSRVSTPPPPCLILKTTDKLLL